MDSLRNRRRCGNASTWARCGRGSTTASDRGFSILEALVTTALLTFAASAIGSVLLTSMVARRAASEHTSLSSSASVEVERLLLLPFGDTGLAAGGSLTASRTGYSSDPYDGDPALYVRWEVTDVSPLMKQIAVVAGRRNGINHQTREIRLDTFRLDTER